MNLLELTLRQRLFSSQTVLPLKRLECLTTPSVEEQMLPLAFGIGGALCSPKGHSLNIVIKTTEIDGKPVAKFSDAPGKNMCKDEAYIEYLKKTVDWRLTH